MDAASREVLAGIRPADSRRGEDRAVPRVKGVVLNNEAQALFLDCVLPTSSSRQSCGSSGVAGGNYEADERPSQFPKYEWSHGQAEAGHVRHGRCSMHG